MDFLKDIIQRCHQRHKNPLRQWKTVLSPTLYDRDYPYQFAVRCAHRHPVLFVDLERADISFMPIGRAPQHDQGPRDFGGERYSKRQGIKDWEIWQLRESWGIQVYTGTPSERDGARWHDLDFTYQVICAAPDVVFACIEALVNAVANPLLTLSKSGGLRFSCRIPDYLHPNTAEARLYTYKYTPTSENPHHHDVYLEIFGDMGHNRWDARYEILLGDLLEPPVLTKEVLFSSIDAFRNALHEPGSLRENELKDLYEPVFLAPLSLGSHSLDLAKEAFIKRGFSYVRQNDGFHYWTQHTGKVEETYASLWEDGSTVWIRASTDNAGLPRDATPITEVWDDTGILPLAPATGLSVSEKVLAVREGKLSPLGIKRLPPVLRKPDGEKTIYDTPEEKNSQIKNTFDEDVRILGLIAQTSTGKNHEAESYVLDGGKICLNVPNIELAKTVEKRYQRLNVLSVAHWKDRMHRWEEVKDIPIEVRMATPFQRGNVCEDPERWEALKEKGGNPRESICPECRVYTACQEKGYLSQFRALQHAKVQISTTYQLFFNPSRAEALEDILGQADETERVCIIEAIRPHELFLNCMLSKKILETWRIDWQGDVLGNFAATLLNLLSIKDKSHGSLIRRVRTMIQTFQWQEEELIQQMCQVKVLGKVVARGIVDAETGKELARFTIEFEGKTAVYIPLDDEAADKLASNELPFFPLNSFVLDEDAEILMSMAQAIRLGILDISTLENIQKFSTTYDNPDWTFWHQLKHFFAYYTRDANAPMLWDGEVLHFWMPPLLHPSVKRLMLISAALSEQHFRKVFPDDRIAVVRAKSTAWVAGNHAFQVRTGTYSPQTILDFDNNWNVIGLSKVGLRLFGGIRAEIERDPTVKHAIVTYGRVTPQLEHIASKENVCFVTDFTDTRKFETGFETAKVIWIVGTPRWAPHIIWRRAQIYFGNDLEPICYEKETDSDRYKDQRVQSVSEETVIGMLTQVVGHARLHQLTDKKIVLMASLPLPDITNRPETLLFDWEDFEVAGGLDKLTEVIEIRQRFEVERENLTAESSRKKVEEVLGCSPRQANRFLRKLRGGNIPRVPLRTQILSLLASDGEKKTAELIVGIKGYPDAIKHELRRLVDAGEIVRVKRGVYALPDQNISV